MALMCRSLGIPARVAVGFYVDPGSEILNFYQVRAFQAHAWVEVYFGKQGWVEFDPTSETPAPGEDFQPFPGPDRDRMAKLISEIVNNQTGQEEERQEAPSLVGSMSRIGREIARIAIVVARLWYVVLPGLYALFLLAVKLFPTLGGAFHRDLRRGTKAAYRRCLVRLTGVGAGRRRFESPLEHAARVFNDRGVAIAPLVESYLQAAFADRFEPEDAARARAAYADFLRSFRSGIAWPRRALGILSPRTTGRR
jgi:hypothetical protein